jgi:hypothetical protein
MTTNTMIQLATVLGLGLGSAVVGYAQANDRSSGSDRSTSSSDCGPEVRACYNDQCSSGDTYQCCDVVYEQCAPVDEHGTIVCLCVPEGVRKNCSTYSCC